jgi:hypothetical protein
VWYNYHVISVIHVNVMSKVTIEALAAMVQRGFKEAKDQLDQGLEEVVHQLDEIELLLTGHDQRGGK